MMNKRYRIILNYIGDGYVPKEKILNHFKGWFIVNHDRYISGMLSKLIKMNLIEEGANGLISRVKKEGDNFKNNKGLFK